MVKLQKNIFQPIRKSVAPLLASMLTATVTAIATVIVTSTSPIASADESQAALAEGRLLTSEQLANLSASICHSGEVTTDLVHTYLDERVTMDEEPIRFRQAEIGVTVNIAGISNNQPLLEIQFLQPPGRPAQTNVTSYIVHKPFQTTSAKKPDTRLSLDNDCNIRAAHQLVYDDTTHLPLYVTSLDARLQPVGEKQLLNPPLPKLSITATDAVSVALIDSGVNYLLPEIAAGLATDNQGNLSGYDYWDMDNRPFDANPARSAFFVQRHGTRTASIVLKEAPGIKLVPYRYPRNNMSRMADLIAHADTLGIKLVGMPLGSNTYTDWTDFESTARNHPHMLFIVSAGNNGRDIDQRAVYPAAMDLENMLVVTSADDFVHPAERTNFGRMSVDYLIPAEQIEAMDFNGDNIKVSGSSYAVARMLAMAARLLQQNPDQSVTDLMKTIRELSVRAETARFVSTGYLGDPLTSNDLADLTVTIDDIDPFKTEDYQTTNYSLPVQLIRLDSRWNYTELKLAIDNANSLYQQCNIKLEVKSVVSLKVPDYLKDLSSGHALTLSRALNRSNNNAKSGSGQPPVTRIFLARDTAMQEQFDANAFGLGNTRNRPWMTNSLWLTYGITDTDIALAHELFHIVGNSGQHSTLKGNLMQDRTQPENTNLTQDQCATAIETGLANGVLRQPG